MRKRIALLIAVFIGLFCTGCASISKTSQTSQPNTAVTTSSDSLSAANLTFASQALGTKSAPQAVTLANTGTTAISISGIAASGDFSESNTCGTSLAAGAQCAISVIFAPTASGTRTGVLAINASNNSQTVNLTGTGAAAPITSDSFSIGTLSFASQTVNTTSPSQAVTLTNTGTTAIAISSVSTSGNFSESNTCGSSLVSGAQCTISVAFTPKTTGTLTGTLSITDSDSTSAQTVSLTGTGTATATATGTGTGTTPSTTSDSLSASSLSFPSQTVNTASGSQTVTLTNTGTTAISISGISASSNFSQSNNCGSSLAAGAQCSLVVIFEPTTTGAISGSLTITDSAGSAPQTVALSGTGIAATYRVAIAWAASSSSGVMGYNVYRSTISGSSYALLNSSPLGGTSYTDSTVTAGNTYYYVTTAVSSSGEQSGYSNQATAVIP
jgi:hypothetical protein